MLPNLFKSWADEYRKPLGVGIRASVLFRDFKQYANPRFKELGRVDFYGWVREYLRPIEEADASGIIFYFGEKGVKPSTFPRKTFVDCTCGEFVAWMDKNKEDYLYVTFNTTPVRDRFLSEVNLQSVGYVTKQQFNEWLRWAGLFYTGNEPIEGRNTNGKTIKFKYNGQ